MVQQIAYAMFALLACNTFIYFIIDGYFLRYLRQVYPKVWNSLDRPSLFWNNSIGNGLKTLGYIFSSGHLEENDGRLSRMIHVLRVMNVVQITLLCVGAYLTLSCDI